MMATNIRWQIFSAIALRKLPELILPRDPIELKVQSIFYAYEVAMSKFSDHEMQNLEDEKVRAQNDETLVNTLITAKDNEEKWSKEYEKFSPGPYNEKLARVQYLFMKQKFGSDIKDQWLLPQALYDPKIDNNLLDTARRALKESLQVTDGYRVVSKVPSSVYSFRYPKKISNLIGFHGAKVFFLKAHLDQPSDKVLKALDAAENQNIKWINQDEATKIVHSKYMTSFRAGLFHEEKVDVNRVLQRASRYASSLESRGVQKSRQQAAIS